jgi:electron transport complex protein RnfB
VTAPVEVCFDGCQGCGACLLTCPAHAIRPVAGDGRARRIPRPHGGTGCGECVEVCPVDAVTLTVRERP